MTNFKLNYTRKGSISSETILFIHPLGADNSVFDEVIFELKNHYNCYAVDIRGHGKSPISNDEFSINQMAKDISYTLDFKDPVHVMGVSIGGMIAMSLAIHNLVPINKLILSDTGHVIGNKEIWQERINLVQEGGVAKVVDMALERWFPKQFRDNCPEKIKLCRSLQLQTHKDGYIGACKAIQSADFTHDLKKISNETLVLNGSDDISTPPSLGRELSASIKHSKFIELEGIGHVPPIQDPSLTIKILKNFLLSKVL